MYAEMYFKNLCVISTPFPATVSLRISICQCLMCLQEGGVLTCGCGAHGQLGHGNTFNASRLRMIFELMGTAVSQVVCGR